MNTTFMQLQAIRLTR